MSKESASQTICVCGSAIPIKVKKPTSMTPAISKVQCGRCKSVFMVKCTKKDNLFKFDFDLFHLSAIAEAMVQWRLDNPGKTINVTMLPWHQRFRTWITGSLRA